MSETRTLSAGLQRLPAPPCFRVGGGRICWSNRRWEHAFGLAFTAIWLFSFGQMGQGLPWLMQVVALAVAYQPLVALVNHVEVRVEGRVLTVRHLPLPWRTSVCLKAEELTQLFCVDTSTRGKGGVVRRFAVRALLKNGSEQVVVDDLPEHTQALYLEQELERALDLRDVPVPGELKQREAGTSDTPDLPRFLAG